MTRSASVERRSVATRAVVPVSRPVRIKLVGLVVVVVAVCFLWLFPAVAPLMPFNDNTIQTGPVSPGPATTAP